MGIENRFREPTPLGWRDISILLKVRVPPDDWAPTESLGPAMHRHGTDGFRTIAKPNFQPNFHRVLRRGETRDMGLTYSQANEGVYHVMELQLQLRRLMDVR